MNPQQERLCDLSGTTFALIPCQQTHSALYWFERLIREQEIGAVLEIGTGGGGTTAFFGCLCPGRVISVNDFECRWDKARVLHQLLSVDFRLGDAWTPEVRAKLLQALDTVRTPGPALFFIDGGNKHREFALYAPHLRPGDWIAVHDVGYEFFPEHIENQAICQKEGLIRHYEIELGQDLTRLVFWQRGKP
jgi:predicted O-methyltransferase YrrM